MLPSISSNNDIVAVDLGSNLIKVLVTDKTGQITKSVVANNTMGLSVPSNETEVSNLANCLIDVFNQNNLPTRNIYLSMPERYTSTQVIDIPALTDAELATSVVWQAQQYIPIPKEELALNYQVLYRPEKQTEAVENMRVLLVGINQKNLDNLVNAYKRANLEPTVLESETISTMRNLGQESGNITSMIINFGASGLNIAVIRNNELSLAISHQTGSAMITQALMTTFNLPLDKAEEYKRNYGINPKFFEGKIAKAIAPIAQTILNDIRSTISFYNNKNTLQTVSKIYLCGGGVLMPGFSELLAANLNLEIIPLNVFANLTGNIPQESQLLYPIATGLLKRNQKQ